MNAQDHANELALAVWRLAEAEALERQAAAHRRAAAAVLGAAHAEFVAEVRLAKERQAATRQGVLP